MMSDNSQDDDLQRLIDELLRQKQQADSNNSFVDHSQINWFLDKLSLFKLIHRIDDGFDTKIDEIIRKLSE